MAVLLDRGRSGRRKEGGSFVSQRPREEPKKVERNGMDGDTLSAGMGVFLSLLCAKAGARKDESEAD